jgi:membrane fusion protein, heavy metal efflux system
MRKSMRTAAVATTLTGLVIGLSAGCRRNEKAEEHAEAEGFVVTAWSAGYEIFAEAQPLVAGGVSTSLTHVTLLEGFAPMKEGTVAAILRGGGGEQVFSQDHPKPDGIYSIDIKPAKEGVYDLLFRVTSGGGRTEDVAAGKIRVGTAEKPGGLAEEQHAEGDGGDAGAVSFLKEQQWRTSFATAAVAEGVWRDGVRGPARVTPAAGGEVLLTASVEATVVPRPWPHVGRDVAAGDTVVKLLPRASTRSLHDLEADAASLAAQEVVARKRVERLGELLRVEAASAAELERARAELLGLEARLAGTRRELEAATTGTSGGGTEIALRAPWAGRVAEVAVSPGQSVAPGTALARLVRLRPVWLDVALRPEDAVRATGAVAGLSLRRPSGGEAIVLPAPAVRLVSHAPEVDPRTATVAVLLELDRSATELPLGSVVEAEVLLGAEKKGIVIPATALVDDAGIPVVYVQTEGESFARREVKVVARQGATAVVEGLGHGERLVTVGGGAIRRASLLSSAAPESHVH